MKIKPNWTVFWIVCVCWFFFVLGAGAHSWQGWTMVLGCLVAGLAWNIGMSIFRFK